MSNPAAGFKPFQTTNDAITLFGRVDWNLNDRHRPVAPPQLLHLHNDREFDDNFDYLYGASRAEKIESRSNSFVTELQSVFSPTSFNVFRFQFSNGGATARGLEHRAPSLIAVSPIGDQIGFGGTFVGFHNDLDERKLQFVGQLHAASLNTTPSSWASTASSRTPQLVPAGHHRQLRTRQPGRRRLLLRDARQFRRREPHLLSVQRPAGRGRGAAGVVRRRELGCTCRTSGRLRPGSRPRSDCVRPPSDSAASPGTADRRRARVRRPDRQPAPTDNNNISPRLSLAYDLSGDGHIRPARRRRLLLRARALRARGQRGELERHPVVQPHLQRQRPTTASRTRRLTVRTASALVLAGGDNPVTCAGAGGSVVPHQYTFWTPEFEFPETFKANVGYEQRDRRQPGRPSTWCSRAARSCTRCAT